jgi:hypothetical protein
MVIFNNHERGSAMKWMGISVLGLALLVACVPVELSVTDDGRVIIPRGEGVVYYNPKTGKVTPGFKSNQKTSFAMAVPNRGGFIAITEPGGGGMGSTMTIHHIDAKGNAKRLHSASNITYLQVSPTGDHVSFARVSDQQAKGFEKNLPELHVIALGNGKVKKVADAVGSIHRWAKGGKHLYIVQLTSAIKDTDRYMGELKKIDHEAGKGDALANVMGSDPMHMDAAPNDDALLFTAIAANPASKKLPAPKADDDNQEEPSVNLYHLDLKAGTVKMARKETSFAYFSPNQTKVLLGVPGDEDELELVVTNLQFKNAVMVARDVADQAGSDMTSVSIYPGWYDDKTVLYIARRTVFGTSGENLMLTTVTADGKTRKVHQPAIDAALVN